MKLSAKYWAGIVLLLLFVAWLGGRKLNADGVWFDEWWSLYVAGADVFHVSRSVGDIWQRIANEEAAAAVLRTQKQMADAMEAITRIQGVPALAARGVPTIDSVRAALADVSLWEPVEAAYGFLFAPATLAKSTAIAQLQALEQKVREEELAAAALVAKAKQDADDAKAAEALADAEIATERKKQDDEAAAERVAQAARDAAAARDKAAAAVALKKAQGVAVQLLTALQGINVALEALTDAESELSCIPEGPERHALEDAWFVGRAALLAAE